jgi:ferrous iron transport protein A
MFPIGLLSPGERGEISAIREGGGKCDCRIEDLGLRVGKTVEMLNNGGGGAILLKVDEARLAIGRGMAMKIMVKR